MLIDFHTHCFPDKIVKAAMDKLKKAGGEEGFLDGSLGALKASAKAAGLDFSVVLPIATDPRQTKSILSWAKEISGRGGIISFASVHPSDPDWKNALINIKKAGLSGIKLHPDYQDFFIDDPQIFPLLRFALDLGLIIVFHAGLDIGLPEIPHATPERSAVMLDHVGEGKMVFAHMGGYERWDGVERFLVGRDIYFDTAYTLGKMTDGQFLRIVKNHGADKILFATDSPWCGQSEDAGYFRSLDLPREDRAAILGENAARLLGL